MQPLEKCLEHHLALDDVFQPDTQLRVVKARIKVNIPNYSL
jgi:hypothetical protein